ncbi:hypothetical protein UP17_14715 [Peribacillus simplex]|uniref:Uncharacterized protein n=1 Tax=Peribacillus simplex TaxID=1478 RepID=A0AAW7IAQ6_9BACI|nr:hypothetical protein [Peribacillus simplex]AMM93570.1 hypothetical protein UP17_14715 [Peribacillus simplex]MDM5453190.1 hypothetical protein [Peribacillus simplex]
MKKMAQVPNTEIINGDIMLDFGEEVPIVGIEFEGETVRKIELIANKVHIRKLLLMERLIILLD